jgi:hypothetical protein
VTFSFPENIPEHIRGLAAGADSAPLRASLRFHARALAIVLDPDPVRRLVERDALLEEGLSPFEWLELALSVNDLRVLESWKFPLDWSAIESDGKDPAASFLRNVFARDAGPFLAFALDHGLDPRMGLAHAHTEGWSAPLAEYAADGCFSCLDALLNGPEARVNLLLSHAPSVLAGVVTLEYRAQGEVSLPDKSLVRRLFEAAHPALPCPTSSGPRPFVLEWAKAMLANRHAESVLWTACWKKTLVEDLDAALDTVPLAETVLHEVTKTPEAEGVPLPVLGFFRKIDKARTKAGQVLQTDHNLSLDAFEIIEPNELSESLRDQLENVIAFGTSGPAITWAQWRHVLLSCLPAPGRPVLTVRLRGLLLEDWDGALEATALTRWQALRPALNQALDSLDKSPFGTSHGVDHQLALALQIRAIMTETAPSAISRPPRL